MSALEDAFTKLLGRQPDDREKQDLYRTRDALKLKNDDALWLLLMVLGHYETLYRSFPTLIREAAVATRTKTREAAEAELKASASAAKHELTSALARAAAGSGRNAAKSRAFAWALACVVTSALSFLLVGWFAHGRGLAAGLSRGWVEAHRSCADEKAAAAWTNTPEGKLAYGLANAGSIRDLAACSGRGWVRKGRICFPGSDRGFVHGWRLPVSTNHDEGDR